MFKILAVSSVIMIAGMNTIKAEEGLNRTVPDVKVVINMNAQNKFVDKSFYGSHMNSYARIPGKEIFDDLQLGMVRIGGNEYDVFNWKTKKSITKFGGVKNLQGFDDFQKALEKNKVEGVYQINLMGFQPELVDGNYVLQRTFDANGAYELIKKLNGEKKLGLKNFSLGNEFSLWNETHSHIWPATDGISADEYIQRFVEFAVSMKKAQEEVSGNADDIKIWGPEISTSWTDWNTGNMSKDCSWSAIAGRVNCIYGGKKFDHFIPYFLYKISQMENDKTINPKGYKLLDYYSFHYYPNFRKNINDIGSIVTDTNGRQLVAQMLESTRVFNDPTFENSIDLSSYKDFSPNILGRMKRWIADYYPNAKLALNEFALDSDYRTNNYHPIVRPLYMADSIGIMATEGVDYFNQFILNTDEKSSLPWVMLEGASKTNLYTMYKLFTNNFKGKILTATDDGGDEVNAYALLDKDQVNVAVINKKPFDRKINIYLKGYINRKVMNIVAPAWSASIIKFNKAQLHSRVEVLHFGAKEMNIPVETVYAK